MNNYIFKIPKTKKYPKIMQNQKFKLSKQSGKEVSYERIIYQNIV
jgi:hypothetical protein